MGGSPGTGGGGMAGMGGTAGAGGGASDVWWDKNWQYRIKISFKNAGGEVLTNFPVMVRLDEMRAPGILSPLKGADVRFVDPDGTPLSYEIDGWDDTGNSFVWVNVPTIDASEADYIWLYYGNAMAKGAQTPKETWAGFQGVYHLTPGATPPQFRDSTENDPGEWNNTQGYVVGGKVGSATHFNGVGFIHVGENDPFVAPMNEGRTVEAWVKIEKAAQNQTLVWQEGNCLGWYLSTTTSNLFLGNFATAPVMAASNCDEDTIQPITSSSASSVGVWRYVTLVINRKQQKMIMYVDGQETARDDMINNDGSADGNGFFRIGGDYNGQNAFLGDMDEVRISNRAQTPKWIAAQHSSMTDNFLVFGVSETL